MKRFKGIILFFFFSISFIHAQLNEGSIYLFDYASVKLSPDFKKETLVHQKIQILSEKGKKLAHLQIYFDAEREKVRFLKGYTITPSGKKIEVKNKDIRIVTPAEFTEYTSLYPGIKVLSINFPGVEIGSIIEYEYKIFTFKPLIENHFWDGFYFQSTEPFEISRYELTVPKKIQIQIYEKQVKIKEKKERFGYITYIWEKKNVPAIIEEILMPPLYEIVPKVYVSTFKSWEEIGRWFFEISREKGKNNTIEEKVNELIKDKKNREEIIASLYHYVCSNIRYVGLEIGKHGYKPHLPEDVFKAKYGDCKDKSNLLKRMLEIAGIKSYFALVNTEGEIEKEIPFPGQFNHAILAIPDEKGYIFLDPTSEVMKYPDLPPYEQGKLALVCQENPELVEIPLFSPERNKRIRKIYATIDKNGNLTAEVKIIPSGIFEAGLRNAFRYLKQIERERSLLRELNSILPKTKLISLEISGIESLDTQLTEKYKFFTEGYGIKVENKLLIIPSLIDKLTDTSIVSLESRKYDLRIGTTYRKEEEIEYILPENSEIEFIPPSIQMEKDFGYFSISFERKNSRIYFKRVMEIRKSEITPSEYPEFKEFWNKISSYDKLPVIINLKD